MGMKLHGWGQCLKLDQQELQMRLLNRSTAQPLNRSTISLLFTLDLEPMNCGTHS